MNIQKIATGVVSPLVNNAKSTKLIGLDYSDIADTFVKKDFSKSAIAIAVNDGKLTQEMIEQMILKRLPRTIKQAELFALEHPELSKEDVIQDTILHMVELANSYKGQSNGDFNLYAYLGEKRFFKELVKSATKRDNNEVLVSQRIAQILMKKKP